MANWCYNVVTFENNPNVLEQLKQLFESLAEKEKKEEQGQLPDFILNSKRYMFSINWQDETASYETKWSPNIEEMKQIADHFKIGFNYYYEELGCLLYGVARYENAVLSNSFLESSDFGLFEENEGDGIWTFEGQKFESEYDILEILLERRQK